MSGNLTNLGHSAQTHKLYVSNIYYEENTGKLTLELPTNFEDNSVQKIVFETNGNIDTLGAFKLFSGTDLSSPFTNTSRYSIDLDNTNSFEIYDNVAGTWRLRIDSTTGQTTFNPPLGGTAIGVTNINGISGTFYPTFLNTSASGTTTFIDVVSTMTYNPFTQTLTVNVLKPTVIKDQTNSSGSLGQVLTSTGSGLLWTSSAAVNDGILTISNGTHITGSGTFTANQATNTSITIGTDATDANTASTIVARDASGNFSAGTITASLSGNATSASSVYVIQNSANADYQIPILTTSHAGNANYSLKVDADTTVLTYNTNSHTLKPANINLSGTFADGAGSVGTSGQYLTSTGTATSWVTLPSYPVVNNGILTISNGTYMTGSGSFTANQATNTSITIGTNATPNNTASTIVARDGTGNFSCGTITGSISSINITALAPGPSTLYLVSANGGGTGQVLYVSSLTLDLATNTLTATTFNGNLTGNATSATSATTAATATTSSAINTTTATAGTYYLAFVNAGTGGSTKTVYVATGLNYAQATNNLTATTFTGALSGNATSASTASTISTTTAAAATYYLTFADAGTGGSSKTVYVDTGLSYNASTNNLSTTTFTGALTGTATNANAINTTTAGTSTYYLGFVDTATGATQKTVFVTTNLSFNALTNNLSTTTFTGALTGTATNANAINTTTQTAASTMYLALTNANTGGSQKTLYTSAPSYNNSTNTLTATNFAGTASNANAINTTGSTSLTTYYPVFVPNSSTSTQQTVYTDSTSTASFRLSYNPNLGLLNTFTLQLPDANNAGQDWRLQTITSAGTMVFNNSWTGGHYPLQLDGTADVASAQTNNLYCDGNTPTSYAELDTPILTASTAPSSGTYTDQLLFMSTTSNDYTSFGTRGLNTGTGTGGSATFTLLVNGNNPMGRVIKSDLCLGVKMYASSAANRTFTYNLTGVSLSMTRNGSAFTNFYFNSGFSTTITRTYTITATSNTVFNLFDPLLNLDIYFEPTDSATDDTYVMTVAYTYTISIAPAGGVFQEQIGNPAYAFMGLDCPAQSSTRLSGTGTFTFNQAQRVTPQTYAVTKTLSTNNQTGWLQNIHIDNNVNMVYNGFFSTSTGVTFPYCFAGGFDNYKIYIHMTIAVSYILLQLQLVDKNGTVKSSGYNGSIVQLGSTYTYTAWGGTNVPVTYTGQYANGNDVIEFDIYGPNTTRSKVFKGYNYGSNTGNMTIVSSGGSIDSTQYPSLRLSPASDSIQGYITVLGFNSRI